MTVIAERPIRQHVAVELLRGTTWTDWTNYVTKITTHRGGKQDGITIKNEVGMLTITLRGIGFNVVEPDFYAGQKIRLFYVNGLTRHPLFTGQIRDLDKQQRLVNNKVVAFLQLVAVDAVAEHNAVTRFGAIPLTGADTFSERIARLAGSATAEIELPTTDQGPLLGRTVYESTLTNHFTLACNTARAMWYVGPDNITRFQNRTYDAANEIYMLSWSQYPYPQPGDLHIIDEQLRAGTRVMYNSITKHILGAQPDDDNPGEWVADERDVQAATGSGSIAIYGRHEVVLTTNDDDWMGDDDHGWIAPFGSLSGVIDGMVWNAQEDLTRIPDLEIGASIWAPRSGTGGEDSPPWPRYLIIGVHHTITPTRWLIELTLIGVTI